jgi:hypothetical protein
MGPDGCQIIKYSDLPNSTYTDLSSYRQFFFVTSPILGLHNQWSTHLDTSSCWFRHLWVPFWATVNVTCFLLPAAHCLLILGSTKAITIVQSVQYKIKSQNHYVYWVLSIPKLPHMGLFSSTWFQGIVPYFKKIPSLFKHTYLKTNSKFMMARSLTLRDTCAFIYKTMNQKAQQPGEHLRIVEASMTHFLTNDMLNIKLLCSWNIHIKWCLKNTDH